VGNCSGDSVIHQGSVLWPLPYCYGVNSSEAYDEDRFAAVLAAGRAAFSSFGAPILSKFQVAEPRNPSAVYVR
jgi:hypothetical protein